MTRHICTGCGTQFADSASAPAACPICVDDRQYVNWAGQQWTDLRHLRAKHAIRWELEEGGIPAIGVAPSFAIPQRALLLETGQGNVLWECISLVNDEVIDKLRARGKVDCIAISHPHFFASMLEWSEALGDIPIYIHEKNRDWVMAPDQRIQFWRGERFNLLPQLDLYCPGGHFDGSCVLHWKEWRGGRGGLFSADTLHVVANRRAVTFMHSIPNYVPLHPRKVAHIYEMLRPLNFDDVYGFTWGHNIIGNAKALVEASVHQYLEAVGAPPMTGSPAAVS